MRNWIQLSMAWNWTAASKYLQKKHWSSKTSNIIRASSSLITIPWTRSIWSSWERNRLSTGYSESNSWNTWTLIGRRQSCTKNGIRPSIARAQLNAGILEVRLVTVQICGHSFAIPPCTCLNSALGERKGRETCLNFYLSEQERPLPWSNHCHHAYLSVFSIVDRQKSYKKHTFSLSLRLET